MNIREATWADANRVFEHLWTLHAEKAREGGIIRQGPKTDRWLSTVIGEAIRVRSAGLVLLALDEDGDHIGSLLAAATELPYDHDLGRVAAGLGTYVVPSARKRGVAGALYTEARRLLRERGFDAYLGAHLVKNKSAQRAITRAGFVPFEVSVLMPLGG